MTSVFSAGLAALLVWQGAAFHSFTATFDRPADEIAHADAIVSLAGASGRLDKGLDLLLAGRADVLLLSGIGKGTTLHDIFPDREQEVGDRVVLLEDRSTSTYENAIEAWAALSAVRQGKLHDVVLLTSSYHMERSLLVFREVFPADVAIHPYPVDSDGVTRAAWWKDARGRKVVLTEYAKYVWYRIRY